MYSYEYAESDSEASEKDRTITETEEEVSQKMFYHSHNSAPRQRPSSSDSRVEDEISKAEHNETPRAIMSENKNVSAPSTLSPHVALSDPLEYVDWNSTTINQPSIWKLNKAPDSRNEETKKRMSDARLSFTSEILTVSTPKTSNFDNVREPYQSIKSPIDSPTSVNDFSTFDPKTLDASKITSPYFYGLPALCAYEVFYV